MPFVRGVEGRVVLCSTFSLRQAASKASATKQEPRSVSTCVTMKGKARTASLRKATAEAVVSSSFTARWTHREQRSMAPSRERLRVRPSLSRSLGRCFTSRGTKPSSEVLNTPCGLYQRPSALTGGSPIARADRGDGVGLGDQPAPGVAGGIDDVLVGEDAVGEPVLAQVLPD